MINYADKCSNVVTRRILLKLREISFDSSTEHLSIGTSPDQPPGGRTEAQLLCWGQLGGAGGGAGGGAAAIILSGDLTISNIHTGHWPPQAHLPILAGDVKQFTTERYHHTRTLLPVCRNCLFVAGFRISCFLDQQINKSVS